MKLSVTVTRDDIEAGMPGDGNCCPIALALKRVIGTSQVWVSDNAISIGDEHTARLSPICADFVRHFDEMGGDAVEPFAFEFVCDEEYCG